MNRRALPDHARNRIEGVALVIAFFTALATFGVLSVVVPPGGFGAGMLVVVLGVGLAPIVGGATYYGFIYVFTRSYRTWSADTANE